MNTANAGYKQNFILDDNYPDQLSIFKAICRFMQSVSTAHATQMGISLNALQAAGLTWVLARRQTLLLHRPSPGSEIEIETRPSALTSLTCRRDFIIREKNGALLGMSLTNWAVLNLQTRHAVRIPEFISSRYVTAAHEAMPELELKPRRLSPADAVAVASAREEDIDLNNHVTNTRYVDLMLDAVPDKIRRECRPAFCDIVYRAEGLAGDCIEIRRQKVNPSEADDIYPALRTSPKLCELLDSQEYTGFRHSLVKRKTKFLFITREQEKELVRGFSLWI